MSQGRSFVICLVGFPGAGKLTIARILARLSGATVIDNHWINDPILRLVTKDDTTTVTDAIWPQVAKVRAAVLETIATLSPSEANYIFTYAGANEDAGDRRAVEEYHDVARRRGSLFIPVRIICAEVELVRRIQSEERRGRKLINPAEAIENVRGFTVVDPQLPDTLTLDVTKLSPEDAAQVIIEHVRAVEAGG